MTTLGELRKKAQNLCPHTNCAEYCVFDTLVYQAFEAGKAIAGQP